MHDKWDGTNLTYFLHGSDIFFSVDKEGWHDDGFMILRRLVQNNISPHPLRQFTTVSWSRHLTFYLSLTSLFSCSWSSRGQTCTGPRASARSWPAPRPTPEDKLSDILRQFQENSIYESPVWTVSTRRNLSLEKNGSVLRIQVQIQNCWEIVAINCGLL